MPWVVPLIAAGVGVYQAASANKRAKEANKKSEQLFSQRKAYKTPKEIMDIMNLTQNAAQTGFGPETMRYLNQQQNQALSGTLDVAKRLGGDPNTFSSLIDQSFNNIFKIGSESELLQMKKFDSLLNATQLLANNRDAEWSSRDNLLKDRMLTLAGNVQAEQQNIQSGTNLAIAGLSSAAESQAYKDWNWGKTNYKADYSPKAATIGSTVNVYVASGAKPNVNIPVKYP